LENEIRVAVSRIKSGEAPGHENVIEDITVGIDFLTDFWRDNYLKDYVPAGGNRIQFITGRKGSGKTHLIEYFLKKSGNYKKVSFSAKKVWIHDFKEIFFEVLRQCDIEAVISKCCQTIVKELGFETDRFEGSFMEFLTTQGLSDPITKREIRLLLNKMFLQNPLMDNNFANACALLAGGQLGHPLLEEPGRKAILGWLSGSKEVKLSTLRNLGLSPMRIAKHNARHMLRSLVEVIKTAGYDGLIICVDDLDVLVSRDSLEEIRYTKLKRDEVYESIRELIDEIDTMRNVFFMFAFNRKLIDDDIQGMKSYQALWLRIQNEVKGNRINRFSNMIDLDKLLVYDVESIIELSSRIAALINSASENKPAQPLSQITAQELLSRVDFSELSLPRMVVLTTVEQMEGNEYGF